MRVADKIKDKELGIDTTGFINWPRGVNLDYFRTESTSYKDLDRFISKYNLLEDAKLVDYGSGKGRIIFYLNHQLGIRTTGIEVNTVAYMDLIDNLSYYQTRFPKKGERISTIKIPAEKYEVKEDDNTFYFFNPFTIKIFEQVIGNIEESIEKNPRIVDVVLYYPGFDYIYHLEKHTNFQQIQTIKTSMYYVNSRECFKVFRYIPD